jgi:PAS domain S-box-containing protein
MAGAGRAGSNALAESLVASLGAGAPIGLAVHDDDLRVLAMSPSLAELSGAPVEELLGRRLVDVLPAEIARVAEDSLRPVLADRRPQRGLEPAVVAGRERGWLVDVYPLERHGRRLVAVVALDVTQSRATRERLRESRAMLARVQQMAGVGSWSWDVTADTWTWSDQLLRIAELEPGSQPPDLATLLGAINPADREAVRAVTAGALRDGEPYEVSFTMTRRNGRRRTVRGRGVPVRGAGGHVVRVDGFAQDVTELERSESRQRVVTALGRMALSGAPISALLPHATDLIAEELEIEHAAIVEQLAGGELRLCALNGGRERPDDHGPMVADPSSLAAFALRVGGTTIVRDWNRETRLPKPPLVVRYGINSSAATVIGTPEAPFGVLAGHAVDPERLGDDAVAFIEAVAAIIASAVERRASEDRLAEQAAARRRLVAQALDAGDRARRGISEALHDGPLQDLLALGHDVSRLQAAGEEDGYHLDRVRDGIGRAIRQIREVMLDLHPVALQVGGLEPALRAVCAQQARIGGYRCDVRIEAGASGVRDELVLSLARELLRNAAKHAHASCVEVAVRGDADGVVLEVADDGVGIEDGRLREALAQGHVGVASSRERAEAIGGRLRVGPRPDGRRGTHATALLPLGH